MRKKRNAELIGWRKSSSKDDSKNYRMRSKHMRQMTHVQAQKEPGRGRWSHCPHRETPPQ